GGEPFVPQAYRHLQAPLQRPSVPSRPPGCHTLLPGQAARQAHHDPHGLPLPDLRGDPVQVRAGRVVPGQGGHGVGEDTPGVGGRQAHADLTDVHPQQHAAPLPGRAVRRSHPLIVASTRASASPVRAAAWPPPWARSALPPPPPPSVWAATLTSAPAWTPRPRAASFVAITTAGRPSPVPVRATTTGRSVPSRARRSVTRRRRSSADTPSPRSCLR